MADTPRLDLRRCFIGQTLQNIQEMAKSKPNREKPSFYETRDPEKSLQNTRACASARTIPKELAWRDLLA